MSKSLLKAREAEALTFIYPAAPSPVTEAERAPRRLWRGRTAAVSVAVAIVLLVALAWVLPA